jgi:hypothetical protein
MPKSHCARPYRAMGWLAGLLSRILEFLLVAHVAPVAEALGEMPSAARDVEEGSLRPDKMSELVRRVCGHLALMRDRGDKLQGVEEAYAASKALFWGIWEAAVSDVGTASSKA